MEIYGPLGLRQFLRTTLNLSRSILGFQVAIHELCHDRKPEDIDGIVREKNIKKCSSFFGILREKLFRHFFSLSRLGGVLTMWPWASHTHRKLRVGTSTLTNRDTGKCTYIIMCARYNSIVCCILHQCCVFVCLYILRFFRVVLQVL